MEQKVRLDIPFITIIKVVAALLGIYLIFLIRDVIALLFITVIFVAALSPIIDYLKKYMHRTLAVTIVFLGILAIVAGILYAIIPPLVDQSKQLAENLPGWITKLTPYYQAAHDYLPSLQSSLDKISSSLATASGNIFSATASIFGGVVSLITVIVLSFYFLLDEQAFKSSIFAVLPPQKREDVAEIAKKISLKVGDWLRGQLSLGLIVGAMDLIGLLIIGVPYALTLALISAVFELIPVVGPILSGAIAAAVALTISPVKALFVVILYVVVQQLENHILVPQIMKKAVGLSPVIVILAIFTGAKLLGITGALLAIPIAASISVIALDWNVVKRIFTEK
jgi:predicted PurR-regulated permease PerM